MIEQCVEIIHDEGFNDWEGDVSSLKDAIYAKCDITVALTILELLHIDQRDPNKPHELAVDNPFFGHPNQHLLTPTG